MHISSPISLSRGGIYFFQSQILDASLFPMRLGILLLFSLLRPRNKFAHSRYEDWDGTIVYPSTETAGPRMKTVVQSEIITLHNLKSTLVVSNIKLLGFFICHKLASDVYETDMLSITDARVTS